LKAHHERTVSQYQITSLFSTAYGKAATITNSQNYFRKIDIWPVNADVFEDFFFAPAETTISLSETQMKTSTPKKSQERMSRVLVSHF
jgi:hypothetical protein